LSRQPRRKWILGALQCLSQPICFGCWWALVAGATIADVLSPSLLLTVVQLCLMVAFALAADGEGCGAFNLTRWL